MARGDFSDDCGKDGVSEHHAWLNPILDYMDVHISDISREAFVMARKVLRFVECEADIHLPRMWVGALGTLNLEWSMENGSTLSICFRSNNTFRYRHNTMTKDSGIVTVRDEWADNIRCLFRRAFGTNNVTRQAMEYHLGRKYQ